MKLSLNELAEMVRDIAYHSNRDTVCETIIETFRKKDKSFTERKARNFRKKCGVSF